MILNYITWNASPEIVHLGPLTLRWYGLLFASGFLIGLFMVRRMFLAEKAPEEWLDTAFVYIVTGAVIGARLGHVFFYDWDYYQDHLMEIPQVWKGGLASHGGAFGVIFALWLFSRRVSKKSILWIMDKVAAPSALAGFFIRLGNLMNSEILGRPADVPWAFLFVREDGPNGLPRHPVQLYESFSYLIIFVILYLIYWKTDKRNKPGYLFGMFMILVWGVRFVWEFFKESQGGFETAFGNILSTGQLLSIPFVAIGLYFVFRPWPKQA
ncbi:MAG: prolipoprotein diacylglyceryl transferase [Lewinellaceae bacterium]|nr:prolipoprotein diacylglyceryl transferase [Lewinellaceae bacterium]